MKIPLGLVFLASVCLCGCKPEADVSSSNLVTPAVPAPVSTPVPKAAPAPVVIHQTIAVSEEDEKLKRYIREERIRQIEAAKVRIEQLSQAIPPLAEMTDGQIARSLGIDSFDFAHDSTGRHAKSALQYREARAREYASAVERRSRELAEAQAHLRSLLIGVDEKSVSIPIK